MNDNEKLDAKATKTSGISESKWRLSERQLGWAGVILGVLGLVSGYYFYAISIQERILTALVDPTRTVIVDSNALGASNVSVLYKGVPVNAKSVTAARVYFWNAGALAIRSSEIYKKIKLLFPTDVNILDASILKMSREVVNPKAQVDSEVPSAVELTFDVLEKNDGVAIQIIYTGPRDVLITPEGLVAGAPEGIRTLSAYSSAEDDIFHFYLQGFMKGLKNHRTLLYTIGALVVLLMVLSLLSPRGGVIRKVAFGTVFVILALCFWGSLFFLMPARLSEYQPLYSVPVEIVGNK